MIPLAIAAALLLQQQVPQRRAPVESGFNAVQSESRQAISDVGFSVADVRSAYDVLRRAAFNLSDGMVIQRAHELGQRCQTLTAVARTASGRICGACFSATVQRAVNAYRTGLPGVGQVGARCAAQVARYVAARTPAATVRRNTWSLNRTIVDGLLPYEARLRSVRQGFGIDSAAPPRRGR